MCRLIVIKVQFDDSPGADQITHLLKERIKLPGNGGILVKLGAQAGHTIVIDAPDNDAELEEMLDQLGELMLLELDARSGQCFVANSVDELTNAFTLANA
jgi:hypothetical protein